MPGLVALLVVLFALPSLVAAWAWRGLALRLGWVDLPDSRRLHVVPTPRGAGVGIVLVVVMAIPPLLGTGGPYGLILAGLLLTAGGGLLDDLRPLSATPKLLLQAGGTLPLALALPLQVDTFGAVGGLLLAWALAMAFVNAWNFMDGSNGLVASQGVIVGLAAIAAGLVSPTAASPAGLAGNPLLVLGAALTGACLGFLPMNVPRARVFLGDVGSHAIGYVVAALGLLMVSADAGQVIVPGAPDMLPVGGGFAGVLAWLPVSAVVIDTGLTLAGRVLRRQRFWLGHREHLYQRAIAAGWSHVGIAAAYAAWTIAASALAVALAEAEAGTAFTAAAGVYGSGILIYLWMGRRWPRPDSTAKKVG